MENENSYYATHNTMQREDVVANNEGLRVSSAGSFAENACSKDAAQPIVGNFSIDLKAEAGSQATSDEQPRLTEAPHLQYVMLKDRIVALLAQRKYENASQLLEKVQQLEKSNDLESLLLRSERYLYANDTYEAEVAIGKARSLLLASKELTAEDVTNWASDLIRNGARVRAMILLRSACDMYKERVTQPFERRNGIYFCICETGKAIRPMLEEGGRSRAIAAVFGIEYMSEMFEYFREKKCGDNLMYLLEAWCSNWIGTNFALIGDNKSWYGVLKDGLKSYQNYFGSSSPRYRIFGALLHRAGEALFNMKEYGRAESYFLKAIDAKEYASDYVDDVEKGRIVQESVEALKKTQNAKECKNQPLFDIL